MDSVVTILPWALLMLACFLALFFHHEGQYWRDRHDELLQRPLSFWQQRELHRKASANVRLDAFSTVRAIADPPVAAFRRRDGLETDTYSYFMGGKHDR